MRLSPPTSPISLFRKGFTLLELLVVVSILAIIAGLILVNYDGFQERAANQATSHTLATLTQTVNAYNTVEQHFPDQLETLLSATPQNPQFESDSLHTKADAVTNPAPISMLTRQLAAKMTPRALTAEQLDSLRAVGIQRLRFIDALGDQNNQSNTLAVFGPDGNPGVVGPIEGIDNPNTAFEPPGRANQNLGRGFYTDLGEVGTVPAGLKLMIWGGQGTGASGEPDPTPNFQNTLVNADPEAVLVALGVGRSCTMISSQFRAGSDYGNTTLVTAPFDGGVGAGQYQHFTLLIDVSVNPAKFIRVVDARGIPSDNKNISTVKR